MDDLISRQAAIDAIERAVTKEVARWSVKELPSAQPEVTEKQVCDYCRMRNLVMITYESFEALKSYYDRRNA